MSVQIGIVGAGHAGVEAARAARKAGAGVTLFSGEDALPYYRPRLVALAFGRADFAAIQMHPREWYAAEGIVLRTGAPVTSLDPGGMTITAGEAPERFDGLILAAGAGPVVPRFAAAGGPFILPLWGLAHANAIRQRVRSGDRAVIVGGGILGIEAALRAIEAGMSVTIVELMERLMPAHFGPRASVVLARRLREKGIHVTLGCAVAEAVPGRSSVALALDNGRRLEAELCVISIGARPDVGLARSAGMALERGVIVDRGLLTSRPRCYAAGDVIQFEGLTRCCAREAAAQGRVAGANLAAELQGGTRMTYQPESLPLMFRSQDFEVYSIGEPGGVGYEEHLLEGMTESVIRSLITKDGIPLGVQMIGTREGFDDYAAKVKRRTLEPPGRG